MEKSREEVLAEREKKKQMKLAAKQKNKEKAVQGTRPNVIAAENKDGQTNLEKVNLSEKIDNIVGDHIHSNANDTNILKNGSKTEAAQEKLEKNEKSREEVMAERERKKLIKQSAKNKNEKVSQKDETKVPPKDVTNIAKQKSKAELRAERREKQEAQRAAKEESKKANQPQEKENKLKPQETKPPTQPQPAQIDKSTSKNQVELRHQQRVKLFSHLHFDQLSFPSLITDTIHPAILELGAKYSARLTSGSNARCVALLKALKDLITDFVTPVEKEFSRALEKCLGQSVAYLNQCRPSSVSMTNALKHIKSHLTQLHNVSEEDAKKKLCDVIDTYIREQIDVAGDAICLAVQKKIANGDVILIFACSSLLYRILKESHREGKTFTVVVVDGGPWFEGREMLRRLVTLGIKCTYVLISALSFIMGQTTKVLLGAHALLANGYVMSRTGSSLVALSAKSFNVPVLVCCETYKFCERVQTDVFVYNELGNPLDFVRTDQRLKSWESNPYLTPLSLLYDITPPDLVTAVVTEIAILPCTSVPVILRIKPSDMVV
ncbi:translation initiation factor eIF-2B subunit delta [Cimex lectularius]|uniref:Translation initiation factor eIF2B subunit delta n=1 Tax=Cimex lectularius TaxID=79782 RepID=A0A8I6RYZ2_CIMLE|nr:translation initiation factor eIF-2B subunit delta [Cimex lectularius]XP_024086266.1 translation initiation factor eIF-2B subunit delta [Cimex lectularius]